MRALSAGGLLLFALPLAAADVDAILRERVDQRRATPGVVVGVVTPEATKFYHYGSAGKNRAPLTEDTLFRVASATKIFTGVLLADMVERGEVELDDPLMKYLPAGVAVPVRGRPITLRDLATHRSGLPVMPSDFRDEREYTESELYAYLDRCKLLSEPGAEFRYSNLGMAVLGLALSRRAGTSYEALLTERIAAPLQMPSSRIRVAALDERLAPGHDQRLRRARFHASNEALAGASEMVSTARDLTAFVAAALGLRDSPVRSAITRSMVPLATRDEYHAEIGLGWWANRHRSRTFVWHGGESRDGYKSFIGLDAEHKTGVVVLSSSRNPIEDIGFHILDERMKLDPFGRPSLVKPTRPEQYVGKYQVRPSYFVTVERKGEHLVGHGRGRPRRLLQIGEDSFVVEGLDIEIDFLRSDDGKVTSALVHGEGQIGEGPRSQ